MKPVAFVAHPDCGRHDTGWGHPEHQGRLPALMRAVYRSMPALLDHVLEREAEPADLADLRRVHTDGHVSRVREAVARAAERGRPVALDADTVVSGASWDAALASAGTVLTAARMVADGEAATGFAASRPPGHHATADRAMGFCLLNNVAIAARALQQAHGVERVLIVDIDVHHGNGTQDIFYDDPSVFYLSLHLSPHYPGTGAAAERGIGPGRGATLNVPLPAGTTGVEYREAFDRAVEQALADFRPGFVLVSAGFDCLTGDPLGGFLLEPADLYALTAGLLRAIRAATAGRVVVALEGGYAPARLGDGAVHVLRALAGLSRQD